jgi:uncharacterized OsmC-like protein
VRASATSSRASSSAKTQPAARNLSTTEAGKLRLLARFDAHIRLTEPAANAVDPSELVVRHHMVDQAELRMQALSGGHLLHMAVAACFFNDILRAAATRGLSVSELRVSADGDFEGDPLLSTGITYEIEIAGESPEEDLRRLVADCEAAAAIPHTLRTGVDVKAASVHVRGA